MIISDFIKVDAFANFMLLRSPGTEQRILRPLNVTFPILFKEDIPWLISRIITLILKCVNTPGAGDQTPKARESHVRDMASRLNLPVLHVVDV